MNRTSWIVQACTAAAWLAIAAPGTAQTCQAVPVDCLQPSPLAQIDGARFAWGSTGDDAADAWVARFDDGAEEPTWRVQLGGSGDDAVSTVTLNRGGAELLVAGATTSSEVEGFTGQNSGGRDGFVVRLDAATGQLLSGAFVGGSDDEELSGVVTDSEGNVIVTGVGTPPSFGELPTALTVVETTPALDQGSPVFLATFDRELTRAQALSSLGVLQVKHPRAWIDCKGNLIVGVAVLKGTSNCNGGPWPDLVYQQSHINQDYLSDHNPSNPTTGFPPGGWGYHGLRWKEYRTNGLVPPGQPLWSLNWLLASGPIPKTMDWDRPGCADVATMNQREDHDVFLHGGAQDDPSGGWMCGNHADMAQLALISAHLFHRWGTPVYTNFAKWSVTPPYLTGAPYAAGLSRVTFRPDCIVPNAYNGQTVDDLCHLWVDNPSQLTCTSSMGIPGIPGNGFNLVFEKFDGSSWGPDLTSSWFSPGREWKPQIFAPTDFWYDAGEWIADPPDGSEAEAQLAILQEASRQSADLVMRPGTVQVTHLDKGLPSCKESVEGIVSARE